MAHRWQSGHHGYAEGAGLTASVPMPSASRFLISLPRHGITCGVNYLVGNKEENHERKLKVISRRSLLFGHFQHSKASEAALELWGE